MLSRDSNVMARTLRCLLYVLIDRPSRSGLRRDYVAASSASKYGFVLNLIVKIPDPQVSCWPVKASRHSGPPC